MLQLSCLSLYQWWPMVIHRLFGPKVWVLGYYYVAPLPMCLGVVGRSRCPLLVVILFWHPGAEKAHTHVLFELFHDFEIERCYVGVGMRFADNNLRFVLQTLSRMVRHNSQTVW